MMALLFYIHISSKLSAVMIRNFYRNKSRKQSLCGQQVLTCSCSAGQLPLQTRAPGPAVPRATCSPATRQALEEEPLANRWRQRSTADQPGAQRPSQGPDIQPQTHHGHKSRSPDLSPVSLSPPHPRSSQGRAPRASTEPPPTPTAPAELRRCARIILHFCIQVCMHTTHTHVHAHMPTRSCVHTPHTCMCMHTHAYTLVCVHTTRTAHTPTHTPHTSMYVHTHARQYSSAKKKALHVCACLCHYLHPRLYLGLCSLLPWEAGRV